MRIVIEHEGHRLEAVTEDVMLSIPGDLKDAPCSCPNGPCGYVHREFAGTWLLELSARLDSQPLWTEAP